MLFFPLLFTFISCSESEVTSSDIGDNDEVKMVKVPIKLSVAPMKIIGRPSDVPVTRTPKTRVGVWGETADDTNEVDENAIENLWVIQYDSNGTLCKQDFYPDVDNMAFSTELSTGDGYTLCFVANVGDQAYVPAAPSTYTDFKKGVSYEDIIDAINTDKVLPMVGIKENVSVPSEVTPGLQVELKRVVARLDFTYKFSTEMHTLLTSSDRNYGLDRIFLGNVPKQVTYDFSDASPTITSSDDLTERCIGFGKADGVDIDGNPIYGENIGIYIPHNARGIGASDKSGKDYATYTKLIMYRNFPFADNNENSDYEYYTYIGANDTDDYNVRANTKYNITTTISGMYQDTRIKVASGTSNCYYIYENIGDNHKSIPNPDCSVIIPIRRANLSFNMGQQISDLTTGWSAEVLWRDYSSSTITIDENNIYKSHGYFKVSVAGIAGNAVIAIRDSNTNDILWSWHIWNVQYDSNINTYYLSNYNTKFMYVWLGGTYRFYTEPSGSVNMHAFPCYYQWGRKDPFPGLHQYSTTPALRPIYASASGSSTISCNSVNYSEAAGSNLNAMQYAVKNPMSFIKRYGSTTSDWYAATKENQNPFLWRTSDGQKTVNDPCPLGFRVAYAKSTAQNECDWDLGRFYESTTAYWISTYGNTYFFYMKCGHVENSSTGGIELINGKTQLFLWQSYGRNEETEGLQYSNSIENKALKLATDRYKAFPIHCVKIE